jgi:hypothetical protein
MHSRKVQTQHNNHQPNDLVEFGVLLGNVYLSFTHCAAHRTCCCRQSSTARVRVR